MGTPAWTKRNRGAARRLTRPARALAIDLSALTSITDPHVSTVCGPRTASAGDSAGPCGVISPTSADRARSQDTGVSRSTGILRSVFCG